MKQTRVHKNNLAISHTVKDWTLNCTRNFERQVLKENESVGADEHRRTVSNESLNLRLRSVARRGAGLRASRDFIGIYKDRRPCSFRRLKRHPFGGPSSLPQAQILKLLPH